MEEQDMIDFLIGLLQILWEFIKYIPQIIFSIIFGV